ncbi:NIPSNAP family protein [Nocardioides sp. AE5]|uniref:NIPSNAP family protein n=1 Tax=Nocardioides sp. AE5 TaxID=2962573 RepID=UPI0028815D83|nr:NIPSNAP family protein [Nocardioides sp. AE5]MDT0201852.1 NIPSNAP family protein [Nocardioides sp. AE5]
MKESDQVLFELRFYEISAGQGDRMIKRFKTVSAPLFERYGGEVVGAWTSAESDRIFAFMLRFDDSSSRDEIWEKYHNDPLFIEARAEQKQIIESGTSTLLRAVEL